MNTFQKYEKYFLLITLFGLIIYFPIFFNGFVWDDYTFIINNPQIHQLNIVNVFGPNIYNSGIFYRPIPAIYFSLLYTLAGSHALLYHFVQLALHITCASLLFLFFCYFFDKKLAFFLSLIFLVSPINGESVAFIGASQSELYFLPGIVALLLSQTKKLSNTKFLWIIGLLLLSALTKETGILFFLLVLCYRYLFKLGQLKEFLYASVISSIFYLLLRDILGGVKFTTGTSAISFSQRLINIPPIIFYYVKTFLFPLKLAIWQEWYYTSTTFQNFALPFIACLVLLIAAVWFGLYLARKTGKRDLKRQKQYIFFSFWFVIGMGILLQISPIGMTVADRWFYFPIVGLLGMLGIALQEFLPSRKNYYKLILYLAIVVIALLSLRTFIRTFDYKDNLTLYAHDTKNQVGDAVLMHAYVQTLREANKTDEATRYLESVVSEDNNPPEMKTAAQNDLRALHKKKRQK